MTKWKLVPVEPTPEMCAVIRNENCVYTSDDELYAALLEAAPQPPALSDERIMEIHREVLRGDAGGNRRQTVILMARAIEREILGGGVAND